MNADGRQLVLDISHIVRGNVTVELDMARGGRTEP